MACDPAILDENQMHVIPSIRTVTPLGSTSNTSKIIQRIKRERRKKQIEELQNTNPDLVLNGVPLTLEENIKWQ